MRKLLVSFVFGTVLVGCATHPKFFEPNGATAKLPPTDPAHIKVLDSVPRGMVIGTLLVDRSKAKDTGSMIEMARQEAAAVGGDFIVWEDSLGTDPAATPAPGAPPSSTQDYGSLGHTSAAVPDRLPEQESEKTPKSRFTVGIFLSGGGAPGQ